MMADELLNAQDLITAKKHDTFHSEVITGKVGGVSTGADIDYATNAVTGQVQKTLPATIDGLDWSYVGKFADGVTFTKKTDFALDSVGTQWIYTGSLPFSATAGTVPSEPTYQAVHVTDVLYAGDSALYRRHVTTAQLAAGEVGEGGRVYVTDKYNAPFDVVSGGTPNGFDIVDAGNSNTAVYQGVNGECDLIHVGAVIGSNFASVFQHIIDNTTFIKVKLPKSGRLEATVNVTRSIEYFGDGNGVLPNQGRTIIFKGDNVSGDAITNAVDGIYYHDFTIQGEVGNVGDGIHKAAGRVKGDRVSSFYMGNDGFRIGNDTAPSNCNLWVLRDCIARYCGRHGLFISDKALPTLPDANGGKLDNFDGTYNAQDGVSLGRCSLNTFSNIVVQRNGRYGVLASSLSYDNTFIGGDYEVNGRQGTDTFTSYADFMIEAGSIDNKVFGGACYNFPKSFVCNEPQNTIVGMIDKSGAGSNEFNGMLINNKESANPRVLDWYEEKTSVVTVFGTTTAGTATYTTQTCKVTRIGNVVTFEVTVDYTGHTGTGNMQISGLPFAAAAGFHPALVSSDNLQFPSSTPAVPMANVTGTLIVLYRMNTESNISKTALAMDAAAAFRVTGSYFVA